MNYSQLKLIYFYKTIHIIGWQNNPIYSHLAQLGVPGHPSGYQRGNLSDQILLECVSILIYIFNVLTLKRFKRLKRSIKLILLGAFYLPVLLHIGEVGEVWEVGEAG